MFRLLDKSVGRVDVTPQSEIEQTRLRMGTRTLFSGQEVKLSNRRAGMGQSMDANMGLYPNSGQPLVPTPGAVNNLSVTNQEYVAKKMRDLAAVFPDPRERLTFIQKSWNVLQQGINRDAEI